MKDFDTDNKWLKIFEFDKIQKSIRDFHEKYFDKSTKNEFNKKTNKKWILSDFLIKFLTQISKLTVIFKTQKAIAKIVKKNRNWKKKKQKKTKTKKKNTIYISSKLLFFLIFHHFHHFFHRFCFLLFFSTCLSFVYVCDWESQFYWSHKFLFLEIIFVLLFSFFSFLIVDSFIKRFWRRRSVSTSIEFEIVSSFERKLFKSF